MIRKFKTVRHKGAKAQRHKEEKKENSVLRCLSDTESDRIVEPLCLCAPMLVGYGVRQNRRTSVPNKIGFTLLEVLISLAIVGLTLTVLIHSQLLSIRQATKAKYHTTAMFLANEILSETFMQEEPLLRNEEKDFEDYPEFSWQREVENSDIDGLKKIKITVSGPENTQIILNTYRLQTSTMQTGTRR